MIETEPTGMQADEEFWDTVFSAAAADPYVVTVTLSSLWRYIYKRGADSNMDTKSELAGYDEVMAYLAETYGLEEDECYEVLDMCESNLQLEVAA